MVIKFSILSKIIISFLDIVLLVLFIYVIYRLFFKKQEIIEVANKQIEPLGKRDLTIEELKQYNGIDDEHICIAICGKVSNNEAALLRTFL